MAIAANIIPRATPNPYPLAFRRDVPFGTCIGVRLPPVQVVADDVLRQCLHPDERPLCSVMKGARMVEWIGGRVASRLARLAVLGKAGPTLIGADGAPVAETDVGISISHTQAFAVALAGTEPGATVGVDVEPAGIEDGNDPLLAERILSPLELVATERDVIATVQRLSIKEAAYKAIFAQCGVPRRTARPHPRPVPAHAKPIGTAQKPPYMRPVSLREISVSRGASGSATFEVSVPIEGVRIESFSFLVEECFLSLVCAHFANGL